MAFLLNGQPLLLDHPFQLSNGTQYPSNWLRLSSPEDKAALGIEEVPDAPVYDNRFYSGLDSDGNLIPRNLDDEPLLNDEGAPIMNGDGEPMVSKGLKGEWIAAQKRVAGELLSGTDWYVVRYLENNVSVPDAVLSYRAAVRVTSGEREAQISGASSVEELAALLTNSPTVYDEATNSQVPNTEPFLVPWPEAS